MYINSDIPWSGKYDEFYDTILLAYRLGYQLCFVSVKSEENYNQLFKYDIINTKVPNVKFPISIKTSQYYKQEKFPIPLIPKIILSPKNVNELKNLLGKWAQKRCLISVESTTKEILEVAARDGRVDMISLTNAECQNVITKGVISLAKQNECALDFSISPFIQSEHTHRTRLLRILHKILINNKPFSNTYIIGSHDILLWNKWLLRGPKETIAILCSILDIPEKFAKNILSVNPEKFVLRFIKRDLELFIENGVEIIDVKTQENKP